MVNYHDVITGNYGKNYLAVYLVPLIWIKNAPEQDYLNWKDSDLFLINGMLRTCTEDMTG